MNTTQKLHEVFKTSLGITDEQINEQLAYQKIAEWDSITHMHLIVALEQAFELQFETPEILDMLSYDSICKQLINKGIKFNSIDK